MSNKAIAQAVAWVSGVGAVIGVVTFGIMSIFSHQGGVYGGYSYDDARYKVAQAMADRYGKSLADQMRFGTPDVVNTHLRSLIQGTGQTRVFHLIGPRSVRYCVSVSYPDITSITKGCHW